MYLLADAVIIDWKEVIFAIVGGLGIFLFGINLMGDSLKALAGTKLKVIIEKTTNTPIKGILVGVIITGLIQSSSGTTALTVGLVRAGLMTLPQAIGIILGANIGTTVTSLLLGLPIKEYALPIMAVGSFLIFFVSRKKTKLLGGAILGFGMLFFGLDTMGVALKGLVELPAFSSALISVGEHPIWGLGVGAVMTAVIQSSSATIGILQELYTTGAIPLIGAVAIVFGSNIGTTVTAIFAAIGGSVAARRTAAAHVLFNVIGSVVFMAFLVPYTRGIKFIEDTFIDVSVAHNMKLTISFAHMGFNLITTFVMFFFIKQLVWMVKKIIRGEDTILVVNVDSLNEDLIQEAPILALEAAKIVVYNMGNLVHQMIEYTFEYSFTNNKKLHEDGFQIEELLDTIDKKAHGYLVKIARTGLTKKANELQAEYVDAIRDFERMGDHCINLLEFFEQRFDNKIELTEDAKKDLTHLYEVVGEMVTLTLKAFNDYDKEACKQVMLREDILDKLVTKDRKRHIMRLNDKTAREKHDDFYVDILSNIERIGDHCNNIVSNIFNDNYFVEDYDF